MAPRIDAGLVAELYHQADAKRWHLSVDDFGQALAASAAKRFASAVPSGAETERYLRALRLKELALACACAAGHEAAWDHFVLEYRPILYRAADALDRGGGARELADSLYADLFGLANAGGERRSLFRYFHGRSSLATWLGVVLAQRLVDRARVQARQEPLPEREPADPRFLPPDPDRDRNLALVHGAFRDALSKIDPRNRLRLRYYYAHGLTLAETGRLLGEHEASVSRHLASARKALRRDVERRLERAGLDTVQVERCFECVTEDVGALDLDRLLAGPLDARTDDSIVQEDEREGRMPARRAGVGERGMK